MTTTVQRPDLSARTSLSKSVLNTADMCNQKAWFELRMRRAFTPTEKVVFGSAVDAGVELVIKALRSGQTVSEAQIRDAIAFVAARDDIGIDQDEAYTAVARFIVEVAPQYDFSYAATQQSLRTVLEGLGECEGHPDVVLQVVDPNWVEENAVDIFDCKTSSRAKPDDAAATSVELGFYGLLLEDTGKTIRNVGYWTWVRTKKPYWQIVTAPYTDEMRRRTLAVARAYARARRADEVLNAKSDSPKNYSFPGGPKNLALCSDCQYNPANGGPCEFAVASSEEVA